MKNIEDNIGNKIVDDIGVSLTDIISDNINDKIKNDFWSKVEVNYNIWFDLKDEMKFIANNPPH